MRGDRSNIPLPRQREIAKPTDQHTKEAVERKHHTLPVEQSKPNIQEDTTRTTRGRRENTSQGEVVKQSSRTSSAQELPTNTQTDNKQLVKRGRRENTKQSEPNTSQTEKTPQTEKQDPPSFTPQQQEKIERKIKEMDTRRDNAEKYWGVAEMLHQKERYTEIPGFTQAIADRFVTDAGNEIPLNHPHALTVFKERKEQVQKSAEQYLQESGLADKVQLVGRPGAEYNCFGFTFAGGTGWLNSPQDVQRILDDNAYKITSKPQSGDVIVYRTPDTNEITHTGIVTKVEQLPDGTTQATEVNSKWGGLGLYRHAPGDAPPDYGTWQIYHSDRSGGSLLTPVPLTENRAN